MLPSCFFRKFAGLLKRWWRAESETASTGGHGCTGELSTNPQIQTQKRGTHIYLSSSTFFVFSCRLQLEWRTLRGWTTSIVTCEQLTSLLETIWCAKSLTLAWLGSLRTTSTQPDKVTACDIVCVCVYEREEESHACTMIKSLPLPPCLYFYT